MTAGRWHLYGATIEDGAYSMQMLVGNDAVDPFEPPPAQNVPETFGGGPPVDLPLLGSWMSRPTLAEINAVLPPGIEPREPADDEDEYGDVLDVLDVRDDDEDGDW